MANFGIRFWSPIASTLTAISTRSWPAAILSTDDDSQRIGGVALLDMPDRHAVESFMAKDPFTEAGLIGSTAIVRWNKIYFDYAKVV